MFVNFLASSNAKLKLIGMDNNNVQATAHKAVEIFIVVPSFGYVACLWCALLAMTNNLKLTKINGKRNKGRKIIVNNAQEMTKAFLKNYVHDSCWDEEYRKES